MPNRVARALKTRARRFLACFAKPLALQMKNIVSQEFKRTERLDLAMIKPEDSPSHTVPIRALNSCVMTGSPRDRKALKGWPLSHQVCWVVSEMVWGYHS